MNNLLQKNKQGSQERMILMTRKSYQKGSLFESDGIWFLRYWERDHFSGKWRHPKKRIGKFKDRKSARLFADKIIAEVNERNNTPPQKLYSDMTFKEFIDTQWRSYETANHHAPSTVGSRQGLLDRNLLPAFGKKKLREVTPLEISDFLSTLRSYSGNTQAAIYATLHLIFEIAVQFDMVEKNPVRPKRHRPKVVQKEKPVLSAEQIWKLIEAMPSEQDKLLILLLSLTAVRINEALALRWQDFEAEASTLFVRHTLYKGNVKATKTESSKAKIELPPTIAGALQVHRMGSRFYHDGDFIFARENGKAVSYDSVLYRWQNALKAIGIDIEPGEYGFHILRHSAGSLAYERKGDLKLVQSGLRHANSQITSNVYVHLSNKTKGEFGRLLEAEIVKNRTLFVPKKVRKTG